MEPLALLPSGQPSTAEIVACADATNGDFVVRTIAIAKPRYKLDVVSSAGQPRLVNWHERTRQKAGGAGAIHALCMMR